MKVMLFANTSWYLYNFRRNLIYALLEKGYSVIVCAPYDDYSKKLKEIGASYQNIKLSQRGKGVLTELLTIFSLREILHRTNPDILLTYTPKGNIYPALVKPKNTKQISNITGLGEAFEKNKIITGIVKLLFKISLSSCDRVFFQNQEDMDTFINYGIVNPDVAVRINGSGTDLVRFKPMKVKKFTEIKMSFLTLGRIIPQKGYYDIISLLEQYPKILQIAEFHILGIPDFSRKTSMKLYEELKQMAANNTIFLHAPVDDVENIINRAHCLLLPSTYNEGVPRSLIEGLACGLPIITTNWKGCRDTVINGKNGYLVQPGSINDLYLKVTRFCSLTSDERTQFAKESRKLAERLFNENDIINRYLELCEDFKSDTIINSHAPLRTSVLN